MVNMGVKNVEAFGDSKLVVQQVRVESQCLDGTLNQCCDRCTQLVDNLDTFHIEHVQRERNQVTNELAQQALGYDVRRGCFSTRRRLASQEVMNVDIGKSESVKEGDESKDSRTPI
jgi:hypothetical protein